MTIKFGKFEKVAGLFVLLAIVGTVTASVVVALKQGWFANKIELKTTFQSGDGLHVGTVVQMAGLRAGSVTKVSLEANDEITVYFQIQEEFFNRIKSDSVAQVVRPFVIGEKAIDISVGSKTASVVAAGALVPSKASMDVMDLLSGRELGQYLETMKNMAENLRFLAENLFSPARSKSMVEIVDELLPTIKRVNKMAVEMTLLSQMLTENKQISVAVKNANALMDELQLLTPALRTAAPVLPQTTRRTIEAIDELVVTLKALQKNFMLRGKVEEVRDEERNRKPAGE